ncbi:glycine oxidase ThiO [Roseiterribacter gracilis]|uniref:Glycine oxidase ThiO n=1 Tax=Roseiterribacter gracilis TaxID=2812848 RepID=A0A8S8XEL9_9PROT|nr:glycine oxidase ThiO [Rhodospirillales bacterium TMPK1]
MVQNQSLSVVIAGAGAIGLAIGWRLVQRGAQVTIVERGASGHGASWAAAGMLAAGVETEPGEDALFHLNRRAQRDWPDFARALHQASGIDSHLRLDGTLSIALTRDEVERLRAAKVLHDRFGVASDWLSGDGARELEPALSPRVAAALRVADDGQVDNRLLVQALRAAFLAAGGTLEEETEIHALLREGGRVVGLETARGSRRADRTVLATGAWSAALLPSLPIRPIKGQMLALGMDPARPLLRHVVWTQKAYLVPRDDGRLLVGATVEEAGFDDRMTAGGVMGLLESAWRALPTIEEAPIVEQWVGHRPGSRDDAPILGEVEPGLVVAAGHHRNGILLTPVTAELIAELVLTGRADPLLAGFSLARFSPKAA